MLNHHGIWTVYSAIRDKGFHLNAIRHTKEHFFTLDYFSSDMLKGCRRSKHLNIFLCFSSRATFSRVKLQRDMCWKKKVDRDSFPEFHVDPVFLASEFFLRFVNDVLQLTDRTINEKRWKQFAQLWAKVTTGNFGINLIYRYSLSSTLGYKYGAPNELTTYK